MIMIFDMSFLFGMVFIHRKAAEIADPPASPELAMAGRG
jgi:hypothetical protein